MGIFSKKKKNELVLLFDIGSSSVGGALFYMDPSGVPKIIFSVREPITLEAKVDHDRFLIFTLKSLKVVAHKIFMEKLGSPKRIFFVLSSPWYASEIRIIKFKQDAQFIFTSKLADGLIDKEVAVFRKEYLEKYLNQENKVEAIELKNMKTKLNGYEIYNPFNQKAKEVEMTLFVSMSQEQVLAKMKEAIEQHFRCEKVKFSSFAMASFTVARDTFMNQENFLLVNIGGEVTDISIIKKDILLESISFPLGCNFLIRGLSSSFDCTLDEAKSYLSLFRDGHMATALKKKITTSITKLQEEWLKNFQEFLGNLSNDVSIPATIFITVDQDLASFFSEVIKSEQFNQYILTESKFRVIFLDSQPLHGVALVPEAMRRDSFLIIESIYINRFLR